MRTILGFIEGDHEGLLLELEGYVVMREYILLRVIRDAIAKLEEQTKEPLKHLKEVLDTALYCLSSDIVKYSAYISESAIIVREETALTIRRVSKRNEAKNQETL